MNLKSFLLLFALLSIAIACNNSAETSASDEAETEETTISLAPFTDVFEFSDAKLNGYTYKDGKFTFDYDDSGSYQLGVQTPDAEQKLCANSAKGQHIHLIFNKDPYIAKYTNEFEHTVDDGEHHILAFLSRSYHESIKNETAYLAQKITVADGEITATADIETPTLFYSRPKGTYVGDDTKKVMLDFYLLNTTLAADGNKVKVSINGEEVMTLDTWQPYYIEGMPMGEHTIKLELIDAEGNTIENPLNPVERTITLQEAPPTE